MFRKYLTTCKNEISIGIIYRGYVFILRQASFSNQLLRGGTNTLEVHNWTSKRVAVGNWLERGRGSGVGGIMEGNGVLKREEMRP